MMKENDLLKLDQLADLMDNKLVIPGTSIRVGLDSIIGLIPGVGDTLSLAISGYIVHQAHKAGVHPILLSRMIWNIMIDWAIGIIPFFGDIFDVGFKANRRNVDLLKSHLKTAKFESDSKGRVMFI